MSRVSVQPQTGEVVRNLNLNRDNDFQEPPEELKWGMVGSEGRPSRLMRLLAFLHLGWFEAASCPRTGRKTSCGVPYATCSRLVMPSNLNEVDVVGVREAGEIIGTFI